MASDSRKRALFSEISAPTKPSNPSANSATQALRESSKMRQKRQKTSPEAKSDAKSDAKSAPVSHASTSKPSIASSLLADAELARSLSAAGADKQTLSDEAIARQLAAQFEREDRKAREPAQLTFASPSPSVAGPAPNSGGEQKHEGPWTFARAPGPDPPRGNVEAMQTEFTLLCSKPAATAQITQTTVLQLAAKYGVVTGKWMLINKFAEAWRWWPLIKQATEGGKLGFAAKIGNEPEAAKGTTVICVYTRDFRDKADVLRVKRALLAVLGLSGERYLNGYKPDAATHLNIYRGNPWKVRATIKFDEE